MQKGIRIGSRFFAFKCKTINLDGLNLGEDVLLPLLQSFSRKDFEHVSTMILNGNSIGDRGAEMIGEGLKANCSLVHLYLVRLLRCCCGFLYVFFSIKIERA
jgi:hypothetical protein